MIDVIGPRLTKLGNQYGFLNFNPGEEQQILELLIQLERVFKEAENRAAYPAFLRFANGQMEFLRSTARKRSEAQAEVRLLTI